MPELLAEVNRHISIPHDISAERTVKNVKKAPEQRLAHLNTNFELSITLEENSLVTGLPHRVRSINLENLRERENELMSELEYLAASAEPGSDAVFFVLDELDQVRIALLKKESLLEFRQKMRSISRL